MATKKKAAAKPKAAPKAPADTGTASSPPDQSAQDAQAARLETMKPDTAPQGTGQTETVSKTG